MAHRPSKQPAISVVIPVHNGDATLVRAIESVLGQPFEDVELIVADCASTDRTASICERERERNIRFEYVPAPGDDLLRGLAAGADYARGRYIMPMRPADWFGAGLLESMAAAIASHEPDLLIPSQSLDSYSGKDHERSSSVTAFETTFWTSSAAFRDAVSDLISLGVLDSPYGMLMKAELARTVLCGDDAAPVLDSVFQGLSSVTDAGVLAGPAYHVTVPDRSVAAPFDPSRFAHCEDIYRAWLSTYDTWGYAHDDERMDAVHHRFLMEVVRCIDNACIGQSSVSSIERTQRVQDMVDSDATRSALAHMSAQARALGVMYKPMVRRNAQGCCIGSRLREIARISHIPMTPNV